jgi:Reverse transcriptase (RNA-dependent DNA polymerase)
MRRKRRIDTCAIYKWKARLTIHGGKQEHGINYWETFSPVVRWSTICLTFILAIKYQWATRLLDFVLAYPQAPVEYDLYLADTNSTTIASSMLSRF